MLEWLTGWFGPVFAKEMVEISRRVRYYAIRAIYVGLLLTALFSIWQNYQTTRLSTNPQIMTQLAGELFEIVSIVQYAAVWIFVPFFICGVIATERQTGTLDLLFTTHLSDREIVLGKLASRLVVMLLLVMCGLPVMSLILLFGGIQPEAPARIAAATLLAILFVGAVAISLSVTAASPTKALLRTYLALLVVFIGLSVIPLISPIFPFVMALIPEVFDFFLGNWFYMSGFIIPVVVSVLLIVAAISSLRNDPVVRVPETDYAATWSAPQPASETPEFSQPSSVSRRRWYHWRPGEDVQAGVQSTVAFIVICSFLMVSPLVVAFTLFVIVEGGLSIPMLIWPCVMAATVYLSATHPMLDRRFGFRDPLLSTLLEPREILNKLFEVRRNRLAQFYIVGLASSAIALDLSFIAPMLFGVMLWALGIMLALCSDRVGHAVGLTAGFALFLCVGVFVLAPFADSVGLVWSAIVSGFILICCFIGVQCSTNPSLVATAFVSLYCFLLTLLTFGIEASFWIFTGSGWSDAVAPVGFAALSPLRWTMPWPDQSTSTPPFGKMLVFPAYCVAVFLTIVCGRWWAIRNFDRLIGRPTRQPAAKRRRLPLPEALPLPIAPEVKL